MKTVCISDLRKNLQLFLKKAAAGEKLTITSRGKKLAMIIPVKIENQGTINTMQKLKKTAVIGDILSPFIEKWDAEK